MLAEPEALAYVIRLWSWTQRYAPSGRFSAALADQLEQIMRWRGARGILITSVREVGLLEKIGDQFEVHDWYEMQGALVEKSTKDALLKRKRRRTNGANSARAARVPKAETAPARDETRRDVTDETNETDNKPLRAKKPRAPVETDALVVDFLEITNQAYRWQGAKDGVAFAELRKIATLEEIRVRWKRGLMATGWRHTATVAQLLLKWNDLATDEKPTKKPSTFDAADAAPLHPVDVLPF